MPKGPPPGTGKLPGEGIPPTVGVPRDSGVLPTEGRPPGTGKAPGDEGQRPRGVEGQTDRGTPGQMDPWAENPWSVDADVEDAWAATPAAPAGDDVFYTQHPNFQGEATDDEPRGED